MIPFGKYLLLERLAIGGMAEVFLAKSFGIEGFEKIIAIKRILPTMAEDQEFIAMFIDEAKIAGHLNHANICPIYELGKIGESHYIAMEYVWGKDLLQIMNRFRRMRKRIPAPMVAFVAGKMCEALEYAHNKRDRAGTPLTLIHRDVSPQNILVSYDGAVKLIDFGIAKATTRTTQTQAGVLKGKFGYMSPEQVRGLPIDHRSDLFAVGTCMYEMVTAERLFVGESDFSTLEKVRHAAVAPPSSVVAGLPREFDRIVMKALSRDPETRYGSAAELQEDIQAFLVSQRPPFTTSRLSTWMKSAFAEEMTEERHRLDAYARVAPPQQASSRANLGGIDLSHISDEAEPVEEDFDEEPTTVTDTPFGDFGTDSWMEDATEESTEIFFSMEDVVRQNMATLRPPPRASQEPSPSEVREREDPTVATPSRASAEDEDPNRVRRSSRPIRPLPRPSFRSPGGLSPSALSPSTRPPSSQSAGAQASGEPSNIQSTGSVPPGAAEVALSPHDGSALAGPAPGSSPSAPIPVPPMMAEQPARAEPTPSDPHETITAPKGRRATYQRLIETMEVDRASVVGPAHAQNRRTVALASVAAVLILVLGIWGGWSVFGGNKTGVIEVRTVPSVEAIVSIDGVLRGRAPLRVERVATGRRVVEISAHGYESLRRSITVSGDVIAMLDVALVRDEEAPRGEKGAPRPPPSRLEPAPKASRSEAVDPSEKEPVEPVAPSARAPEPTERTVHPPAKAAPATSQKARQAPVQSRRDQNKKPAKASKASPSRTARRGSPPRSASGPSKTATKTAASKNTGTLMVNTMPWARVFVDGRDTGKNTPVRALKVSAGSHRIGLRTPDGTMHTVQVNVAPGETVRVTRRF